MACLLIVWEIGSNQVPMGLSLNIWDCGGRRCSVFFPMSPNLLWVAPAVIFGLALGGVIVFLIYLNCGVHPRAGALSCFFSRAVHP